MRRGNGRLRETFPTPTTAVYGVNDPLLRRRAPRLLLPIQTKQKGVVYLCCQGHIVS